MQVKYDKFLALSYQEYIVTQLNNNYYVLLKKNCNYDETSILDLNNLPEDTLDEKNFNNALRLFIWNIQSKLRSRVYQIPADSSHNPWYLVWSVLFKKEHLDSYIMIIKRRPICIIEILRDIFSRNTIHHRFYGSYLKGTENETMYLEIYKINLIFNSEYNFDVVLHLYEIHTKQTYLFRLDLNCYPVKEVIFNFKDRVTKWNQVLLENKLERKRIRKQLYDLMTPFERETYAHYGWWWWLNKNKIPDYTKDSSGN